MKRSMFEEFMKFMQTAEGIGVVVAGVLALVSMVAADWVPGFTELAPRTKRIISLITCLGAPVVGLVVGGLAGGVSIPTSWVEYANAVSVGFGVFYATHIAHTRYLPTTPTTDQE